MKIPNKVKIGNLYYDVLELVDSEDSHNGKSSERDQKIFLFKGLKEDHRNEVFFHEITHQILDQMSFNDESKNENLVNCLANGFYQVLKDNNLLK